MMVQLVVERTGVSRLYIDDQRFVSFECGVHSRSRGVRICSELRASVGSCSNTARSPVGFASTYFRTFHPSRRAVLLLSPSYILNGRTCRDTNAAEIEKG